MENLNDQLSVLKTLFIKDSYMFMKRIATINVFLYFLFGIISYGIVSKVILPAGDYSTSIKTLINESPAFFISVPAVFLIEFAYTLFKSRKLFDFGDMLVTNFSYEVASSQAGSELSDDEKQTIRGLIDGTNKDFSSLVPDITDKLFKDETISGLLQIQSRLFQITIDSFTTRLFPVLLLGGIIVFLYYR